MSNIDPVSITALVVSLVALIATLLQAAQQYATTAYEYRHCSKRTVGGWHRHSHRRFLWNELRFEVLFATPKISIITLPSSYIDSATGNEAQYSLRAHKGSVVYTAADNPWFLDLGGTRTEARCSWLSLLNDASAACLQVDIDKRTLSYDYMPGIYKPMAQVDRKSFLTLMSLFCVQWQGDSLTGAGQFCEVTSRDLLNFGTVYSYRRSENQRRETYYIVSEKARSAMFNQFDLGFHIIHTYNSDEVYKSLLGLVDNDIASTVQGFNTANGGWSPGLSESISCFAEPEMPKAIDHETGNFKSIFSGIPTISSLQEYPVLKLLSGENVLAPSESQSVERMHAWIVEYHAQSCSDLDTGIQATHIVMELKSEARRKESQTAQAPVLWSVAHQCLPLIRALDTQMLAFSRVLAPGNELQVQREFARMQIRFGCNIFTDTTDLASANGGFWTDHIVSSVAKYYVQVCTEMGERFPEKEVQVYRRFVINRMIRGALWHVHNGNAPNQQERVLECTLSSRWLADVSSVWLD